MAKQKRVPTHKLYHVRKFEVDGKTRGHWTHVATGFTNADGSVNLAVAVPVVLVPGETFQVRPFDEKPKHSEASPAGEPPATGSSEDEYVPF